MEKLKYLFIGVCSLILFAGCLDEYQELNTDPEQLNSMDPRNVFTGATLNFNNSSRGHLTGKYSGVMVYMQYLVPSKGASDERYILLSKPNERPQPSSPAYGDYYDRAGLHLDYLMKSVIPKQKDPGRYNDVGAISQILLSYKQWQVLDTYGAAPVTEAFKAQDGNLLTPGYDLYQKSLDGTPMYKKIDADIKAAVEKLRRHSAGQYPLGNNDYFYGGDIAKWIKFANTLRVKMAQRLEKADAGFYGSVANEVLSSAGNVMGSNGESCIYYHPNDYNNNTDDIQDITSQYCASAAFVNFLKSYGDPRLPIMVRRNGFGEGNNNKDNDGWFKTFKKEYPDYKALYPQFIGRYVGMSANPDSAGSTYQKDAYLAVPYHKEDGAEANMEIRMRSQVESRYYVKNGGRNGNNNMPKREIEASEFEVNQDKIGCYTPILTYPEACFMFAEIALKKGSAVAGKGATAWYREGIRASMEQYRGWAGKMHVIAQSKEAAPNYSPLTDEKVAAYLARPEFREATLEKIISQQWVNLYMQPEEMWATWKRTGLPSFKDKPVPEAGVGYLETVRTGGKELAIPRRNSLPVPNSLNIGHYNEAVRMLMEDAAYGTGTDRTEGRIWWDR